jgi:hypothetical protein
MGEHRNQNPVRIAQPRLSRLDNTASYDDNLILEGPEVVNFLTRLIGLCIEHHSVADSIFMRFSTLVLHVLLTKYIDVVLSRDEQKLRRIISSFTGMLSTHYIHCKSQVEDCKGEFALLAGLDSKHWFETF